MARIFLNRGEVFKHVDTDDDIRVRGGGFEETLKLLTDATGNAVSPDIENVELPTSAANTTFRVDGTSGNLEITSGGNTLVTYEAALAQNEINVQFGDGNLTLSQVSGGEFRLTNPTNSDDTVVINQDNPQTGDSVGLGDDLSSTGGNVFSPGGVGSVEAQFTDPEGIFDGVRAELEASLEAAWQNWMDNFSLDVDSTIETEVIGDSNLGSNVLAQAKSNTTVDTGEDVNSADVVQQGTVSELKTGSDPNGEQPDVEITIPDVSDWDFNTSASQAVDSNEFDAFTILTHELGHALGFNGFIGFDLDTRSTFDTNVAEVAPGDFEFDGSTARSTNGDEPVALAEGDPFHLAVGSEFLMAPSLTQGTTRDIGETELAMLSDSGVPVSSDIFGTV